MDLKKAGALVTAAALSVSVLAGSAYADTGTDPAGSTTTQTTTSTPTTTATSTPTTTSTTTSATTSATTAAPTIDPAFEAALSTALDGVIALRGQISTEEAQLQSQTQTNEALSKQLRTSVGASDLVAQAKALQQQLKSTYSSQTEAIKDQIKNLQTQIQAARAAKDQKQAILLQLQARELQAQVKAIVTSLQPQRDQLKDLEAQIKAKHDALKAVLDQVSPLQQQEKGLWAKDKDLVAQRNDAWKAFDAALQALDQNGMLTALGNVTSAQQQILANLQAISALKSQVTTILQNASTTLAPAQAPAPAPAPAN